MRSLLSLTTAALLVMALPAQGDEHREHAAHVHGQGRMTLAISGTTLDIGLELPAETAFGFEHIPATPEERSALESALRKLGDIQSWLSGLDAAHCHVGKHELGNPFDTVTTTEGHIDLDASWSLTCDTPPKALTVELFSHFDHLKHLDVDMVTDNSSGAEELTAGRNTLRLP